MGLFPSKPCSPAVRKLMTESNVVWLPDALEEQLYQRVLDKVLKDLEVVLSTMRIQILGKEIHFSMTSSFENVGTP